MKETFRQSMAWLHTWTGLVVGWLLYFVFLTGTFGYVNAEVDRWMRPEQPAIAPPQPAADLLPLAERRLRQQAPDAELWQIALPGERGAAALSVGWRSRPLPGEERGRFTREALDPQTGLSLHDKVRETGGGTTLYVMHYALHYIPYDWAIRIVGVCSMCMLVAILTGIVAHKRIFRDFFTFRPGRGQRSWLDGHNLLGVTALPFHLMITWSGLIFFLFSYMPVAVDALYPKGEARDRFQAEAYGLEPIDRSAARPAAPLVPLAPLLGQVEQTWGADKIAFVIIDNPGRDNARVTFYGQQTGPGPRLLLRFDGVTGAPRGDGADPRTAAGRFNAVMLGLHEGRFAGPVLRMLYVVAGLAGTAMIATGLLLWSTRRKERLRKPGRLNAGLAVIDVLNLGTIIGLPIGIAAYFWANRLLPVGMSGRAAWEAHAMFIAWGLSFLHAIWRPPERARVELCWLAAGACGLLPLVNALTTDRHLGATIPTGDWAVAAVDLGALAAGLFLAFVARAARRKLGAEWTARTRSADGPEAEMR